MEMFLLALPLVGIALVAIVVALFLDFLSNDKIQDAFDLDDNDEEFWG